MKQRGTYFFIPPALLMVASLWNSIYIERSMIIVLPPFVMMLAIGVQSVKHSKLRHGLAAGLAILCALALYNLWWAKADQWTVWMPNPDWRAAASYFADQENHSDDRFQIVGATLSRTLNYYYTRRNGATSKIKLARTRKPLPLVEFKEIGKRGLFRFLFDKRIETVYLLHNRHWTGAFPKLLNTARRDRKFLFEEKVSFKGLDIYRFSLLAIKPESL
jgi:hypothetical protein